MRSMHAEESLEARLRRIENELAVTRARARRRTRALWGAATVTCVVAAAVAVADPATALPCNSARSTSFFCFNPDQPARADSVNHNFEAVARWVESKVGVQNPANTESAPTGSGGLVTVGNTSGVHLALDGDEVNARNGTQASGLFLQEGPGAGDTALNSVSGRVFIGGAGPTTTAKLGVNGLVSVSSLQVGAGGTTFTKIVTGTIGNCSVPGSAGDRGTISFGTTFSAPPLVFLSVEEPDQTGCTSARTNSRTNSGFSFQSWVGPNQTACDCIHWLAVGQ